MMLKRLNFLRNSLSSHNANQTTNFLRDKANKIRDDRILELWKMDQEKPSVYELVQNMKVKREQENATSSTFNNLLN